MTEEESQFVSGGVKEPSLDFPNNYYCTIVNQFYIQLVNGVFNANN
ncbi:MAG: hypothetical protein AB7I18_02755 [Candidatus Berkiella sp.]